MSFSGELVGIEVHSPSSMADRSLGSIFLSLMPCLYAESSFINLE